MKYTFAATIAIAAAVIMPLDVTGAQVEAWPPAHADSLSYGDISNRCSLTDRITIASWDNSADGFTSVNPGATLRTSDKVDGWSTVLFEGSGCLEINESVDRPADQWRSVRRTFATPPDLRGRNVAEYGIWVSEGPGRDFVTRLRLTASDGRTFDTYAHIIPSLWRGVMFDLSNCKFLNAIAGIEISVKNDSQMPWKNATIRLDGLAFGYPLDMDFDVAGSTAVIIPSGGCRVWPIPGAARIILPGRGASGIEISTRGSRNSIYNPPLDIRNTIALAIENRSDADSLRVSFITDIDSIYTPAKSKTIAIARHSPLRRYAVNISDLAGATGTLQGLRIEPKGHRKGGDIDLHRISFDRETPITPHIGDISACRSTGGHIRIEGALLPTLTLPPASTIRIYEYPLWRDGWAPDSLTLLASIPAARTFAITDIADSRLDGRMTHLSSRLTAMLHTPDGRNTRIGQPFYIENWRQFCPNPYSFDTRDAAYYPEDYGAKANGVTSDNAAIQRAIDAAAADGGGRVVLRGDTTAAGPRFYIATDLNLRSGINLVIEPGAVLRQSDYIGHYTSYRPEFGHDNIIPGIPWTHCMYTNLPLILAKDANHVKITGGGTIRMADTYSTNPAWTHYARHCSDRLHAVPIAVCNTGHVEISNIDIIRCSNYHTIFYRADSVFIGNLKMVEVACMSGDGISLGNAVTNVDIERAIFESNDDGIVLASSYKDPRGGGWRQRVDTIDSSVRNIRVAHSYIDSNRGGAGKAIAIIPWGSTNPRQDWNEIDNITVTDCVLRGGHSVGSWPDNPFDGKVFTNTEPDDYAPVKNLHIADNEYLSPCDLFGIVPTTVITDAPFEGSHTIKNSDFTDRTAYWTHSGGHVSSPRSGCVILGKGARIYQGLTLSPGRYTLKIDSGRKNAVPYVATADGTPLPVDKTSTVTIPSTGTYLIGAKALQPDTEVTGITIINQ